LLSLSLSLALSLPPSSLPSLWRMEGSGQFCPHTLPVANFALTPHRLPVLRLIEHKMSVAGKTFPTKLLFGFFLSFLLSFFMCLCVCVCVCVYVCVRISLRNRV